MKGEAFLGTAGLVSLFFVYNPDAEMNSRPPINMILQKKRPAQMEVYIIRLVINNESDKPRWFVLPYFADDPLPHGAVLRNEGYIGKPAPAQPFEGLRYRGRGGTATQLFMYGAVGFRAFQLPAAGKLELDGYMVEASKTIEALTVWEADRLLVNGKTPLEKWLPYSTLSGKNVKVASEEMRQSWTSLDVIPGQIGSRTDYPREKVDFVKAEAVQRWKIKFQE